jgi:carbon monoxide dehydrogenase subunit G
MKEYTVSIDIDVPRDRVVELFADPQNMFHWQNGLQSFEHVSGEPGHQGAISKMVYQNGNRHIELREEITSNNLPDEFSGVYSWGGGSNTLVNHFFEVDANRTRWESTCCYQMKSVLMKLMAFFFRGSFKEQNLKFLRNFKAFAEDGTSVKEV